MSITAVPIPPTRRGVLAILWLGIVAAVVVALWLALQGTAAAVAEKGTPEQFLAYNKTKPGVVETASGLQYQVLAKGEGTASPTDGDYALINYVGKLRDGSIFDASKQPTPLPVSGVVPGFSEGLKLMHKKAKYRFWLKPSLGYGETPPPGSPIKADSVLIFDVELLDFISEAALREAQQQQLEREIQQRTEQGGQQPPEAPGAAPQGR